ncbi:MAG: ADP-ribosylglycohydrolase family protein [Clostridia bacterium]|nr:ADP-ribosylglycohydrolase family protein [Clostridia bacterium]
MKFKPTPYNFHIWENYAGEILTEYRQCLEEGLDVEPYKEVFESIAKLPEGEAKGQFASVIGDLVHDLERVKDYEYNEPSNLEGIRELRNLRLISNTSPAVSLEKKVEGAWYGRICGCLLGKPVECAWTSSIQEVLKKTNNFPMTRYIKRSELRDDMLPECERWFFNNTSFADMIECAPFDDDTNYTVMGQCLIEDCGINFTPRDVLEAWIKYQGKNAYCTAERVAYRNYVAGYLPPYTAIVKNPYREWIGAQIRGDYYGYITSNPSLAAELAWRDASISHIKNGIYGEMLISAMLACAHNCEDVLGVIYGGLAQIPSTSRLYKQAMDLIEDYKNGTSQEEAFNKIHTKYDYKNKHDWCHTISNALIVIASLLYGKGDYGKSICMAVETGFDTDCNGATVGSILGMMYGIDAIGNEWTDVINGTLQTQILGHEKSSVDALVKKTLEHIERYK